MFKAGKFNMPLGKKTYIMGILNYTPDSFSDGGKYYSPEKALSYALEMQRLGADIIDLGANSTRPGADILSSREEKERLLPVLDVLGNRLDIPLSVDTFYPECAEIALENGASIINDVSGTFNGEIAGLVREHSAGYIVMHNGGGADICGNYENGIADAVRKFFDRSIELAEKSGLCREQLCLDIGIGFGKSRQNEIELLSKLRQIKPDGTALLVAASRKRFIGVLSGEQSSEKRDAGTVAAHTAAIAGGADIIRVHDVYSAVQGARVADGIFRGTE